MRETFIEIENNSEVVNITHLFNFNLAVKVTS